MFPTSHHAPNFIPCSHIAFVSGGVGRSGGTGGSGRQAVVLWAVVLWAVVRRAYSSLNTAPVAVAQPGSVRSGVRAGGGVSVR
jgi:hypothetical protein